MGDFMDFEDEYEGSGDGEDAGDGGWTPNQCEGLWLTYFMRHVELTEAFQIAQSK